MLTGFIIRSTHILYIYASSMQNVSSLSKLRMRRHHCVCVLGHGRFNIFHYFIYLFKRQIPPQQLGTVEPAEKAAETSPQVDEAKMLSAFCL